MICYIGLGSNLGDRNSFIQKAIDELDKIAEVCNQSKIYETPPWGDTDQPSFLNSCVELKCDLPALDLLSELKKIEDLLGRTKTRKWGPRVIDLDLLFYGSETIQSKHLTVPHPELHKRSFVLKPLADIAGQFLHPVLKLSIKQLLDNIDSSEIHEFNSEQ